MFKHNKQVSLLDCGLACTKTILSSYGISYEGIEHNFDVNTTQGLSLYDIEVILKKYNVSSESYEIDDYLILKKIETPSIMVMNRDSMPHYVVLLKYEDGKFIISDPAQEDISVVELKELIKYFSGIILISEFEGEVLNKSLESRDKAIGEDEKLYISFIKNLSFSKKATLLVLGILRVVLPIMMSLILQYIMMNIITIKLSDQIFIITSVLVSLLVFTIITILDTKWKARIENEFLLVTLKDFYSTRLENFSVDRNNEYILGYFWNLLTSAAGIIQKFYLRVYFVMFVIIFGTMIYFNYIFSIITFVTLSILFIYNKNKLKKIEETQRGFVETSSNFTYLIESSVEGLYDITSYLKEKEFNKEFDVRIAKLLSNKLKSAEISNEIFVSVNIFNILLAILFMLSSHVIYIDSNVIDYSNSILIILLLSTILQPLLTTWIAFKKSKYSLDFISLKEETEKSNLEKLKIENIKKIDLLNLQVFRKDKLVFENLNITLKSGKIYQILGENGSGKSTLLKILQGLIVPSEGDILINDNKIVSLTNTDIREYISVYSNDFNVFVGSVEDNIKFDLFSNREGLSYNINEFVGLPNNYQISQRGSNISSGQKQKVLLLRALYNDKDIYLFDEPTSNLDVNSRKIFYSELEKLKHKGKIICIVSHDSVEDRVIDEVIEL